MGQLRAFDLKLQGSLGTQTKTTLPIVRLENNFCYVRDGKASLDTEAAIQDCIENLVLTSAAQSQVDQHRRDQFKILLPNDLRSLASDPKDGSKLIFDDNLEKRIQERTAQYKLKASLRQGETLKSYAHSTFGGYDSQKYSKNSRASRKIKSPLKGRYSSKRRGYIQTKEVCFGNQY